MVFNQKGVIDRSKISQNISFHRNLTYEGVKKWCIEAMWQEADAESFFIADGSGVSIELEIVSEDGTSSHIRCTQIPFSQRYSETWHVLSYYVM